jgi:hypothetical protein
VRGCRFLEENGDCRINFPYTNSEFALAAKTKTRRGWGTQTSSLKEKCSSASVTPATASPALAWILLSETLSAHYRNPLKCINPRHSRMIHDALLIDQEIQRENGWPHETPS